jgi:hypothetical protein
VYFRYGKIPAQKHLHEGRKFLPPAGLSSIPKMRVPIGIRGLVISLVYIPEAISKIGFWFNSPKADIAAEPSLKPHI